ncbi:MAG: SAM-dependent methyltransferase [Gammaproteobacteria bacterium]|nr:SAM-dependent methyltransferase [Gammaproteobacteria bacterium]
MIGLAEFMQHALYAPGLGYYTAGNVKFGGSGDFVTAPEISPLFGRVLAQQAAPSIRALQGGILEFGAGSGALAVTLLKTLAELDALPASYQILEVSPELCARQQEKLIAEVPELASIVVWIDALPEKFRGVVVANEVLDALPVERFVRSPDDVLQLCVGYSDGNFVYQTRPAGTPLRQQVLDIEAKIGGQFADGYTSEVSLGLKGWISDLLAAVDEGVVFLFDYGVTCHEYYAAERDLGWLRCHFRHHAHNEPLIYPGIQDITAWVNFSGVADAAFAHGAEIAGFVTQALFLMNGGLENELADFAALTQVEQIELSRQIKLLTLPSEMGEHFKCMGLCKGAVQVPDAFSFGDRAHNL